MWEGSSYFFAVEESLLIKVDKWVLKKFEKIVSNKSSIILPLRSIKNSDVYRAKDYLKMFCKSSEERAMETINLEKRNIKMIQLTNKRYISYHNKQICHICLEKFENKCPDDKKY